MNAEYIFTDAKPALPLRKAALQFAEAADELLRHGEAISNEAREAAESALLAVVNQELCLSQASDLPHVEIARLNFGILEDQAKATNGTRAKAKRTAKA